MQFAFERFSFRLIDGVLPARASRATTTANKGFSKSASMLHPLRPNQAKLLFSELANSIVVVNVGTTAM